jgi:hypothetical protein
MGIFLGPFSRGADDDLALIDLCIEQAVEAAAAGFAFGEQHFNHYEPYCNPFLMGAHIASYLKNAIGAGNFDDVRQSFRLFVDACAPELDLQCFPAPTGAELRVSGSDKSD